MHSPVSANKFFAHCRLQFGANEKKKGTMGKGCLLLPSNLFLPRHSGETNAAVSLRPVVTVLLRPGIKASPHLDLVDGVCSPPLYPLLKLAFHSTNNRISSPLFLALEYTHTTNRVPRHPPLC